jgi:hypothetical protein
MVGMLSFCCDLLAHYSVTVAREQAIFTTPE